VRLYYWFKSQGLFRDLSDFEIRKKVADVACCNGSTVHTIIQSDQTESEDKRGHPIPKPLLDENKVPKDATNQLKFCLESCLPISSKDIRSWILAKEGISLQKNKNALLS